VPAEIRTLWRTAKACCELVYCQGGAVRLLLWIGPRLVYDQVVSSYHEAISIAAELSTAHGRY